MLPSPPTLFTLSFLAPIFTAWKQAAIQEWLDCHPVSMRPSLSGYERHRFVFDRTMYRAETEVLPVEYAQVRGDGLFRWLCIEQGDVRLAIWFKHVDEKTLFTSNYPTENAIERQRNGCVLYQQKVAELYICGHTLAENVAGDQIAIDQVWFTQEALVAGKRSLVNPTLIYSSRQGHVSVAPQQQHELFETVPQPVAPPQVVVKPKIRVSAPAAKPDAMPVAGLDANRVATRAINDLRLGEKKSGSRGA